MAELISVILTTYEREDALAAVDMHAIQSSGNCIRNTTTDEFAGAARRSLCPGGLLVFTVEAHDEGAGQPDYLPHVDRY